MRVLLFVRPVEEMKTSCNSFNSISDLEEMKSRFSLSIESKSHFPVSYLFVLKNLFLGKKSTVCFLKDRQLSFLLELKRNWTISFWKYIGKDIILLVKISWSLSKAHHSIRTVDVRFQAAIAQCLALTPLKCPHLPSPPRGVSSPWREKL